MLFRIFRVFCILICVSFLPPGIYGQTESPESPESPEDLIDLEQHFEPALISTQQIHIPNHPHGFNPSLVPWKKGWLLSFREIEKKEKLLSYLYFVTLDDHFRPTSPAQKMDTHCQSPADGRLLFCGEKLYCVYGNTIPSKAEEHPIWRIWVAEVQEEKGLFTLYMPTKLTQFQGESPNKDEKNWAPFVYDNTLLLTQHLKPHRVLRAQVGLPSCTAFSLHPTKNIWRWGPLRGGTPALLIQGRYLAFFHSAQWMRSKHSQGLNSYHYFMGAYTFSPTPPFAIESISVNPIVGEHFYSGAQYPPHWNKPVQAIFPCGLAERGPHLLVAYGRQDHEIWIATFDTQMLLTSLQSVLIP